MAIKISKLLIANRGEIAVRIIRTATNLGIKTVAVYSEADADSMHVHLADESVCIGGPLPSESYLRIEEIIRVALDTGCQAIHPGYGFLSERAEFSDACANAGIIFVGPPSKAMRHLGGKIDAKQIAVRSGVPITPGFFESGATDDQLHAAALEIGYPVMLKASAGGGGRGMRIVREDDQFFGELATAKDEALKGFGDDAMMVEKLVDRPRHIEVQFIADQHGNCACLFERECSIQRRHQKLIEEAPSPYVQLRPEMWNAMRDATARLVSEAGYFGAGTAEYMVDDLAEKFYFLEVNARLQVEHCVTEQITGIDLVAEQIRIAENLQLTLSDGLLKGDRAAINGHSIEVRIVAEDVSKGFLPSIGKIIGWAEPRHPGIRFETGFGMGSEISRFYDSMVAKVIATGETREQARSRLISALNDFHVLGIQTNIGYLIEVLQHPEFVSGAIDTGFLGREFSEWVPPAPPQEVGALAACAIGGAAGNIVKRESAADRSVWATTDNWRNVR